MEVLLRRENAFTLFRNLNQALLMNYIELKNTF